MDEQTNLAAAGTAFTLPNLCQYFSERSPQPMVAVEGTSHIVRHVNAAFMRLTGARRGDLIGLPFAQAVPEETSNGCSSLLDRVYHSGTPECLTEQKHYSASVVYWSYSAWPILGSDKHPVGVMIQATDSTETATFRGQSAQMNEALMLSGIRLHELSDESEALNERLKAAIKDKEYFIAVLSHELRTPLNPVLIAASLLQHDQRLEPDTRGMMQMIHRNITLEARLIDDLLDMIRMERGKLTLERSAIDLRVAMEQAVEVCSADLKAAKLTLQVDLGDERQMVHGDAGRLQQVFSNLLRNAIKFTPAPGHVLVRCRREGNSFVATVIDDGVGIDRAFIPRAFSAFEQGDKTRSRKAGLGLGLAICKTIIDLHEGSIAAHSEGRGRGATFMVTLPILGDALAGHQKKAPAVSVSSRPPKRLRILLVEDHADTAILMSRLLKVEGHAVEWAGDMATGLKLAESNEFDLLLSDLGLPDGTGMDLMRTLRERGSTLPGIVLSGYGQDQDFERSREAGFAAYLIKPLSSEAINNAIAMIGA